MSESQKHRGQHPQDRELFSLSQLPVLRTAVGELSWLLTRGYAEASSLKLVGDRHELRERQRTMVARAACTDAQRQHRAAGRHVEAAGREVFIDGFNMLISVEAALSGGVLFRGRDGALRDLASVHGSYRSVEETNAALERIGRCLEGLAPKSVTWLFDQPVSNSGRLAQRVRELAEGHGWPWEVRLAMNPDRELIALPSGVLVCSSDALVLDHVSAWLPLAELVIQEFPGGGHILNLRECAESE